MGSCRGCWCGLFAESPDNLKLRELLIECCVYLVLGLPCLGVVGPELFTREAVNNLRQVLDFAVFLVGETLPQDKHAGVQGWGVIRLVQERPVGVILPFASLSELGATQPVVEGAVGIPVAIVGVLATGEKGNNKDE